MERKELLQILTVGLRAMSPYNLQPWAFQHKDDKLLIFGKYSHDGFWRVERLIFYCLGTLLENLSEGARHYHYEITSQLNTDIGPTKPLCEVTFKRSSSITPHDISHVLSRYTNRKIYRFDPVPPGTLQEIRTIFSGPGRDVIDVTGNSTFIDHCARLERVRLNHPELWDEMIDALRFSACEAENSRRGLDLRNLEVGWVSRQFLRLAAKNKLFRNFIGTGTISQILAESYQKKQLYGSSLLLLFKNSDWSNNSIVHTWMDLQKITNFLHKEGLNSHLIASGIDIIKIKQEFFSPRQRKTMETTVAAIEKNLNVRSGELVTLLRIGYAEACEIKSLRMDPQDLLLPETT